MTKRMLIDAAHNDELRVVVINDDLIEEFEVESASRAQTRGNIYVGEITRVEPSLQAAFVSYGGNRNGFLAFSEVHPSYFNLPEAEKTSLLDEFINQSTRRGDEDDSDDAQPAKEAKDKTEAATTEGEEKAAPAKETKAAKGRALENKKRPQRRSRKLADESIIAPATSELKQTVLADAAAGGESLSDEELEENARALAMANAMAVKQLGDGDVVDAQPAAEDDKQNNRRGRRRTPRGRGKDSKTTKADKTESTSTAEAAPGKPAPAPAGHNSHNHRPVPVHRRYSIGDVLKAGQKILIQIVKEERGTKGAALTTYISLPGRFTVLMPNTPYAGGISRKITDGDERRQLKSITEKLKLPAGQGLIVRTAGLGQDEEAITRDIKHLQGLWENISKEWPEQPVETIIHEDSSLVVRAMRDMLTDDISEVIIAGRKALKQAKDYTKALMPDHAKLVREHRGQAPLFAHYKVEMELHQLDRTRVNLPSGGYLIINQTEALVAVDVNSGRATQEKNIEETALKTNVEAAHEMARQLRLRDLAGLIVIDFIDMEDRRNERTVERALREALRRDRARIQVGSISEFGLMEMSRQRLRPSLGETNYVHCAHCNGTGVVRSPGSAAAMILRGLEEDDIRGKADRIVITAHPDVALYLLNHKRDMLRDLEENYKIRIVVNADGKYIAPDHRLDLIRVSSDGTEKSQTLERTFREEADDSRKRRKRRRGSKNDRPERHDHHDHHDHDDDDAKDSKARHHHDHEGDENNHRGRDNRDKNRDGRRGRNRGRGRHNDDRADRTDKAAAEKTDSRPHTRHPDTGRDNAVKPAEKAASAPESKPEGKPAAKPAAASGHEASKPRPVNTPVLVQTVGHDDEAKHGNAGNKKEPRKKSVLQRWWGGSAS